MKCENCDKALATTPRSRPVSVCKHILCEACVSDGSCPKCGVFTEEPVETFINTNLLQNLAEVERYRAERHRIEVYHCSTHRNKEIDFLCFLHESMMCSACVFLHMDHRDKVVPYSREVFEKDVTKFTDFANNINNECSELVNSFKVAVNTPDQNLYSVLSSGWAFIDKYGRSEVDYEITFPRVSGEAAADPVREAIEMFDSHILSTEEEQRKLLDLLENKKRKLALLFRASRDGDTGEKFHSMCNNQGSTVIIVSANGKKFGGFAEASWIPANGFQYAESNFLFMIDPHIKLLCRDPTNAQTSSASHGPLFGAGCDLFLNNNCRSNNNSFSKAGISYGTGEDDENCVHFNNLGKFVVTEFEVFTARSA